MTNDWIMRRNFSESFTVDKGSCLGSFRGTQTTCHRSKYYFEPRHDKTCLRGFRQEKVCFPIFAVGIRYNEAVLIIEFKHLQSIFLVKIKTNLQQCLSKNAVFHSLKIAVHRMVPFIKLTKAWIIGK